MTILKKPFRPACNPQGLAKLTFINAESIVGKNDRLYLRLNFICMGMDRSINHPMSLFISPTLDTPKSIKILQKMGMGNPNEDELRDFLDSCKRQEFVAHVSKGNNGYWDIDVDSLEVYKGKNNA